MKVLGLIWWSLVTLAAAVVLVGLVVVVIVPEVYASVKSNRPHNDQIVAVENPNQYFYGYVKSGDLFRYEKRVYTAVQVHPIRTSNMYDSQITFCDNVETRFQKLSTADLVVITYSRVPRSSLCYDFVSVDVVKPQ